MRGGAKPVLPAIQFQPVVSGPGDRRSVSDDAFEVDSMAYDTTEVTRSNGPTVPAQRRAPTQGYSADGASAGVSEAASPAGLTASSASSGQMPASLK